MSVWLIAGGQPNEMLFWSVFASGKSRKIFCPIPIFSGTRVNQRVPHWPIQECRWELCFRRWPFPGGVSIVQLRSEEYLRVPHTIPFPGIVYEGKVVSIMIIVNTRAPWPEDVPLRNPM